MGAVFFCDGSGAVIFVGAVNIRPPILQCKMG